MAPPGPPRSGADPELGKAVPYGVYDIGANSGWVSVGIDHDTAAFAVNAIRSWWQEMGKTRYCPANRLVITADSSGSNSARNRLWKAELQRLADETGLTLIIRHPPPGTSKWNRIEHRLFSFITGNWRGQPLLTHQVIIELIVATRTQTGLTVRCRLDQATYPKGVTVSDDELIAWGQQPANPFSGRAFLLALGRGLWTTGDTSCS